MEESAVDLPDNSPAIAQAHFFSSQFESWNDRFFRKIVNRDSRSSFPATLNDTDFNLNRTDELLPNGLREFEIIEFHERHHGTKIPGVWSREPVGDNST